MTKFGIWCARLYILRLYTMVGSTKDTPGVVFNYWNPVSWVLAIIAFMLVAIMEGFPEAIASLKTEPFRVNPWYAKNNKEIEWIGYESSVGD